VTHCLLLLNRHQIEVEGLLELPDAGSVHQVEAPDGVRVEGVRRRVHGDVHAGHPGVAEVQKVVVGDLTKSSSVSR
jgi:hypothetical protein